MFLLMTIIYPFPQIFTLPSLNDSFSKPHSSRHYLFPTSASTMALSLRHADSWSLHQDRSWFLTAMLRAAPLLAAFNPIWICEFVHKWAQTSRGWTETQVCWKSKSAVAFGFSPWHLNCAILIIPFNAGSNLKPGIFHLPPTHFPTYQGKKPV